MRPALTDRNRIQMIIIGNSFSRLLPLYQYQNISMTIDGAFKSKAVTVATDELRQLCFISADTGNFYHIRQQSDHLIFIRLYDIQHFLVHKHFPHILYNLQSILFF